MSRIKLLIVYPFMDQSGSQRWIYEICKHINKEKFQVGVLTDEKYLDSENEPTFENYYYRELKKINVELFERLNSKKRKPLLRRGVNKIQREIYKAVNKELIQTNSEVVRLLKSFDAICLVDTYGYSRVQNEISKLNLKNFFIVLHSHKSQYGRDPYSRFDKNKNYNFTYFCAKQIEELSESGFDDRNNQFFYNPLVLNLSNYPQLFNPITENRIVISVFTRISRMKPIGVFIEAFERLQKQLPQKNYVLNIYGKIEHPDYQQEMLELIESLKITEGTVRFMGHTDNIAATIGEDKINLYWGTTCNTSVGYASIEVGAMGVPCIFWNENLETASDYAEKQTNGLLIAPNRIDDFVERNLKYLKSNELLEELSHRQREYFINEHNIVEKIKNFEDYVASMTLS